MRYFRNGFHVATCGVAHQNSSIFDIVI
uniref:Uncharacterized protein n=1 Tax=Anguilla anguilla TaxID=7936 RepID=A0A0E9W1T9_ANGAN